MPVAGKEAVRTFFSQLLGLAEVPKLPHLAVRGGCWFEQGPVRVHLGVERDFAPARKAHVAFLVQGLPGLRLRLAAAGIEAKDDQPFEGYDRTYVADPFGNRIELIERKRQPRIARRDEPGRHAAAQFWRNRARSGLRGAT